MITHTFLTKGSASANPFVFGAPAVHRICLPPPENHNVLNCSQMPLSTSNHHIFRYLNSSWPLPESATTRNMSSRYHKTTRTSAAAFGRNPLKNPYIPHTQKKSILPITLSPEARSGSFVMANPSITKFIVSR